MNQQPQSKAINEANIFSGYDPGRDTGPKVDREAIRITVPQGNSPEFPTMAEIEKWFNRNYAGFDKTLVTGSRQADRVEHIVKAVMTDNERRIEWMRQNGNAEWYGERITLVYELWNYLQFNNRIINQNFQLQLEKLQRDFENYQKTAEGKIDELGKKNQEQEKEIDTCQDVINRVFNNLKLADCPTAHRSFSIKTRVAAVRKLIRVCLEIINEVRP